MAANWPALMTTQLRTLGSKSWATPYPEAAQYKLGDYGPVVNGAFTRMGNLGSSMQASNPSPSGKYQYTDKSTKVQNSGGKVSGNFYDPEEGVDVKAGVEWQWSFSDANVLLIQMPVVYTCSYANVLQPVEDPAVGPLLWEMAYQNKWMNGDGTIKTGFSVVVGLEQIAAGFVAGSESGSSQFTLQGTASGISALFAGQAEASYGWSEMDNGGFTMIWPQDPAAKNNSDSIASIGNLRTIAVTLLSFQNYMPSKGAGSCLYPYLG